MKMSVIALYNDFEQGARAVEGLVDAGFDRKNISIVANDADNRYSSRLKDVKVDDGDVTAGQGAGFGAVVGGLIGLGVALIPGIGPVLAAGPLAAAVMTGVGVVAGAATGGIAASLIDLGVSEEDATQYVEGIKRGGALVTVGVDSDEYATRAEGILNRYNPVNIHQSGAFDRMGTTAADVQPRSTLSDQPRTSVRDQPIQNKTSASTPRTVNAGEQQKLQVVEENLNVGKREVQGGTVRVSTRVTEHPVEEQVHLHDEKVVVDRHPVDRPATGADLNNFQEATIEVTEKREEPVVSKSARVVEEVVVGKQAQDRTETVRDTVRRKDVDVEGAPQTSGYADYETRFRNNFNTNYANSGGTWETYSPAYQYGYQLANDPHYRDYTWDRLETDAQRQWETTHPNTWQRFKNAIHDAWDEVRGQR